MRRRTLLPSKLKGHLCPHRMMELTRRKSKSLVLAADETLHAMLDLATRSEYSGSSGPNDLRERAPERGLNQGHLFTSAFQPSL